MLYIAILNHILNDVFKKYVLNFLYLDLLMYCCVLFYCIPFIQFAPEQF